MQNVVQLLLMVSLKSNNEIQNSTDDARVGALLFGRYCVNTENIFLFILDKNVGRIGNSLI